MKKLLIIIGVIVVLVVAIMAIFSNPEAQKSFEDGRRQGQEQAK